MLSERRDAPHQGESPGASFGIHLHHHVLAYHISNRCQ
jgi:hypothetical protein